MNLREGMCVGRSRKLALKGTRKLDLARRDREI